MIGSNVPLTSGQAGSQVLYGGLGEFEMIAIDEPIASGVTISLREQERQPETRAPGRRAVWPHSPIFRHRRNADRLASDLEHLFTPLSTGTLISVRGLTAPSQRTTVGTR
jgi:hypothetical protein